MAAILDPANWIERAARNHSGRLFLKAAGREITYAELCEESVRFAASLLRRDVLRGDRVAVQVEKSVEAVLLYIACLRLGAVYVPISVANTPNEVDYFLRDSKPRLAVIRPADAAWLEPLARRAGVLHVETLGTQGEGSLLERARPCDLSFESMPEPSALAAIVYTSGTTGQSKGAMLTRGNLVSNAAALADAWRFTSRDILLHALPLFHIHGLFVAINTALAAAASILLLPKFEAAAAVRHLPEVTVFMGVPTYYTRLLQQPSLTHEAAAGVRLFISGSAPLLAETYRRFFERTGHRILERYGMTETLINTSNPCDGARIAGSVGLALPGICIRVSSPETGAVESNPDAVGALEVKGPNVFAGYWEDLAKTRAGFTADGWFKTEDLGRIDRGGYVYIVGRAKDLVISGGYNVYPQEVETQLNMLAGVFESAVFGLPHPDFGEGVTAAVVCTPGAVLSETQIIDAIHGRLAAYKVPKRVLLVDELPRNAMGKVQKNTLRATYASLYRDG